MVIGTSPNYGLTAVENNPPGYDLEFCYECVITPSPGSGLPIIPFTKDSLRVIANPLDCSASLADAGFTNPASIPFNSAGSFVIVVPNYSAVFTHT